MSDRLTLLRPDDWHIHLRDGAALPHTVADAARQFARAIIMPNLVPPVRNADEAEAYRQRILAARPTGSDFATIDGALLSPTAPVLTISARPRPAASCMPPSYIRQARPPTPLPA